MIYNDTRNCFDVMRKFGMAGFAFFFVKGILWLTAPILIAWLF